ncbi:type II toxin-antitoxin system death-on-curing family toxin [Candidatus Saccharibacteria bacterium]|nr:MAG: type II toxin-antitoxin system death-on-curing family toxin [Candidatus Saccharibacteria bacterium]
MRYITLEQVLQYHAAVLTKDGGMDGVRDIGRLDSAVATQYQVVFAQQLYCDVPAKAAALIYRIINDHPFVDGNKRTAMLVGLAVMELNGYRIKARAGEIEDLAVAVTTKHLESDSIKQWLVRHTRSDKK